MLLVAKQRRIAIFIKNGNAKIGCLARFLSGIGTRDQKIGFC